MADFVPNIALGRAAELYNRVKTADPSAARLYLIPVDAGAVTDATLRDCDTFADMVSAGLTERSSGGWGRKTLAAADLATLTPDDTNDRMPLDIADQTWATVTAGTVTDVVYCYAAVASPTNAQLVPIAVQDYAVTPTGADEILKVTDFYRAQG